MLLKIYLKFDNPNRQDEHLDLLPPSVRILSGGSVSSSNFQNVHCHHSFLPVSMHTDVYFYYKSVPLVYPYFLRPHTNSK